jgi:electron transfer flavoprotein beta subunit
VNVAVCFKQVPDSSTRVRIADNGVQIAEEGVSFVVNPYDEYAIAKAREIADETGGEVTLITVGPDRVTPDIRKALAQGGDKAVHLKTGDVSDSYAVARVLADEIKEGDYQVVIVGKQAIDDDMSQTAQMLGEFLGWGAVTVAVDMVINGNDVVVKKEIEGGLAEFKLSLPCVISAQKGLKEAVYPSLKALMKAKKLPVTVKDISLEAPKFKIENLDLPPEKGSGKIFENGADDVPALLDLLRNEAKVING